MNNPKTESSTMRNIFKYLYCFIFCLNFIYLPAQNKITLNLSQPLVAQIPEIYLATVQDNKNMILWSSQPNTNVRFYNIYRNIIPESTKAGKTIEMIKIGQVTNSNFNSFTDISSLPHSRSHSYIVSSVDNCGNELFSDKVFQTLYLNIKSDNKNSDTLRWNSCNSKSLVGYKIFQGPDLYHLSFVTTTALNDTMFVNSRSTQELMCYQIEATVTLKYYDQENEEIRVLSNIAPNSSDYLNIFFEPKLITTFFDKTSGNLNIFFPGFCRDKIKLSIYDLSGRLYYAGDVKSEVIEITKDELTKGMNIIHIVGDKFNISKKLYLQ